MISLPLEILCRQLPACIIFHQPPVIKLAVVALPGAEIIDALRFASQCQVEFECWPRAKIENHRLTLQNALPSAIGSAPLGVPELAQQLLSRAIELRASDIHLESSPQGLLIRLRIDGLLQCCPVPTHCTPEALITRFKVMAGLDIAESRLPQDGQLSLTVGEEPHSFRLSTLHTRLGEKMVLRRLELLSSAAELHQCGLSGNDLKQVLSILSQPQGLILVTGPTGSGKTFTLYSMLNHLNNPEKNLYSVEDPIEMPLTGVNQTQINNKAGLGFARILRALLRQDPDVIMIGEIRDNETADIAVKAAQTGHLVLSTLHTNSTRETIVRLRQMGIAGYLLAASLRLVIAQRLVRALCPHCRKPAENNITLPDSVPGSPLPHWQATGCDHCFDGYYGRLALFEILPVSGALHQAISRDASPEELGSIAARQGVQPLFSAGIEAVRQGKTSWTEMLRVTGGAGE